MEYNLKSKPEKFFLEWERKGAKMLFEQWKIVAGRYQIDGLASLQSVFQGNEIDEYLAALYQSVGGRMARETYNGINTLAKKDSILDFAIQRILFYLRQFALTKVTSIATTATDDMRAAIEKMIVEGLNSRQIAGELVRQGRVLSRQQAIRIARTEAVAAYNFGAMLGAEATGLAQSKTWRSANQPKRTRRDHLAANGQTVAFNEFFIVGGERMAHPGDPRASAKQVVNCRCTMKFSIKKDF